MKKRLFVIISLTALFLNSNAFSTTFDDACKIMASEEITSGDFTQKRTIAGSGRTLKSEGIFTVCKKGVIWASVKPIKNTIIITETKIIQIDKNGNKSALTAEQSQIFILISQMINSLFSGNKSQLEENFTITFEGENDGGNASASSENWKLSLAPKDSTIASAISVIELEGDSHKLTSMNTVQANGDSLLYEFKNQTTKQNLTAEQEKLFAEE